MFRQPGRPLPATAVLVALPLMMSSAGAGSAGSTAAPSSSVVAQWRAAVRSVGIVGASLGIVQGDDIVEVAHEGLSDVLARRPVDDETIYHWASITKTFTAVAVMQLRDGGRLSLDDPVVRYLPELRAVHNPHGSVEAITIRHLLSHTAGFRSPTWPWGSGRPWHPFEPPGWAQLAAMLPYTEVEFPPGSRFQYSNPGIVFLGRIVETLSGEDFETYVDKRIFTPLGMAGSYFDLTAPYRLPHRSHSYVVRDGVRTEQPFDFDTGVTVSNGGLNAPLADLLTWLRFLAGRPGSAAARARYDAVLARASLEEMWRPQIDAPDQDEAPDRPVKAGLVFFLETHVGRTYVAHSGHQNGFASHLYLDPERGVGYVVAFNTFVARTAATPRGTDAVDRELRDALFTSVFPAVASR